MVPDPKRDDAPEWKGKTIERTEYDGDEEVTIYFDDGSRLEIWAGYDRCSMVARPTLQFIEKDGC
jgi:hypothetical protein